MSTPSFQTDPLGILSLSIPSPSASVSVSPSPTPNVADHRDASLALRASFTDDRRPVSGPVSPSASTTASPTAAASSSHIARPSIGDDIEMEPIAGHRRRRSSLMSPAGGSSGPSRSHAPGTRTPQSALSDEPKIVEEGAEADSPLSGKDESENDSFSDEDLHDDEETGLTRKDKRRKQKKRRKNTRLDQRVIRDKNVSAEEKKEADKDVFRRLIINGVLILLWYFFSLSISLYNKWMFDEKKLNFAFPLFTTSMHMLVQFVLASLVLYCFPHLRPGHGRNNSDLGRSRHEDEPKAPLMTKMFYLTRIGPCGASTGLDIGLGNASLKFISLTFYTMCKSSSLAFVLIFAFMFRLETPTWRLVAIIATMTMGVVLMVFGEVEFKFSGFALVISAAFFSGFRWSLTQILLLRNPATSNPFSSIFFLTPVMFLTLILLAVPVEGFGNLIDGLKALSAEWGIVMTPLFLLFPGCIAFCMTASEFALLQRTSVVTLSIAGIFKEVVTISAASIVFHDHLTLINLIGLLTTMAAIFAYNYIKITKMRQEAQVDVHVRHHVEGDSNSSGSGSDNEDPDDSVEETAGLLRRSFDRGESRGDTRGNTLITSDGDFQPLLQPIAPSDRPDRTV
ncbi:hypothetical protein G7046_g645 [Stylonectria norvegica]|nr:hypothetical protein G7046_g645 [Stylonectria norvegica]